MHTKAFKNGNSEAVRIPGETAFESTDIELNIKRIGNKIIIQPVAKSPGDLLRQMKAIPTLISEGRVGHEQRKRKSL